MTTKPFNPFRAALPRINTYNSQTHRGGISLIKPTTFVCWAIGEACWRPGVEKRRGDAAIAYIHSLLGCVSTVSEWLANQGPGLKAELQRLDRDGVLHHHMQDYRWRWLNHMADQYDAGLLVLKEK